MDPNRSIADGSLIDELERVPEPLRDLGRTAFGVPGPSEEPRQAPAGVGQASPGRYPLIALCLLVLIGGLMSVGYFLVSPNLDVSLGIGVGSGPTAFSFLSEVVFGAMVVGSIAMAAFCGGRRSPSRGRVAVAVGLLWAVLLGIGGLLIAARWELLLNFGLCGFLAGGAQALQRPLLVESYPPRRRLRALSIYSSAIAVSGALAAILVALTTVSLDLTWRVPIMIFGAIGLVAALGAWRLRDPGTGVWDSSKLVEAVQLRERDGGDMGSEGKAEIEVSIGFVERLRRVMAVPSVRPTLTLFSLFGLFSISMQGTLLYVFEEQWGMRPGSRDILLAVLLLCAVPGLILLGLRGERMFGRDPAQMIRAVAFAAAIAMVCVYLAIISSIFWLMVALLIAAYAGVFLVLPVSSLVLLTVVHPTRRVHASALAGIAVSLGALVGNSVITTFDTRFGLHVSAFFASLFGLLLAAGGAKRRRMVPKDVDSLILEIVEDEKLRSMVATGRHLPLLGCRHIDFSYGQVQVLFDVHLTLDEGEMVALLGTNGAGKSTLLRVISGLGRPSSGTVHFRGADITHLSPTRRVELGITQVAGGKAVFGPMSVVDNMKVFGFTIGQDRKVVNDRIDEVFGIFPILASRRYQLASTLSGGEQQMLALGKAFIMRPRLLLVDELSLGLAPKIVGQLLEIVRRINAAGTSVVLVEQSVNIALSVVEHAYYMEKGEMRFDGRSSELLKRPDLLRAVFLEGAARGFSQSGGGNGNGQQEGPDSIWAPPQG